MERLESFVRALELVNVYDIKKMYNIEVKFVSN